MDSFNSNHMPTKAELHEFTNIIIDTKLKIWNCTKKSTKLYFRILIYKNYTLDELNFTQKKTANACT